MEDENFVHIFVSIMNIHQEFCGHCFSVLFCLQPHGNIFFFYFQTFFWMEVNTTLDLKSFFSGHLQISQKEHMQRRNYNTVFIVGKFVKENQI